MAHNMARHLVNLIVWADNNEPGESLRGTYEWEFLDKGEEDYVIKLNLVLNNEKKDVVTAVNGGVVSLVDYIDCNTI